MNPLKISSFRMNVPVLCLAVTVLLPAVIRCQPGSDTSAIWVTGYYAGWMQGWENYGHLPAEEIDYSALTHIIHFALVPRADGTLDSLSNSITEVNSRELLSRAHAAGVKVLISVGGWGTDYLFRSATNPLTLNLFVNNLVDFMQRRGYDGLDIDWEYLDITDAPQYTLFITTLRAKLDSLSPRPLLTAAAAWRPEILAPLADVFDQINIMTYDLSGAWPGWVAWHNAPIFDGGFVFPSTLRPVPSANGMVEDFHGAGIPLEKLGIGIDFYGYVWSGGNGTPTGGVTQPRQSWLYPPFVRPNVPFFRIWENYYRHEYYHWDSLAQAPYLSIDDTGSTDDKFVSFCDELSCQKKVRYAREKGLGGVFIWELGGGYLPEGHPERDRLLRAIKAETGGTALPPVAPLLRLPRNGEKDVPPNLTLTWDASRLLSQFRVQIAVDSLFQQPVFDDSTIAEQMLGMSLDAGQVYFWRVAAKNPVGWSSFSPTWSFTTARATGAPVPNIPSAFELHQNYPNPFNSVTWIRFDLPEPSEVTIDIFTVLGEHVVRLVDGQFEEGSYRRAWFPGRVPSGVYFYRLIARPTSDPVVPAVPSFGGDVVYSSIRKIVVVK